MPQDNLDNIQPLLEQAASIYSDMKSAREYLEIEDNLQTDESKFSTIADIIDHLQEAVVMTMMMLNRKPSKLAWAWEWSMEIFF